jgi:hypothetical protein
MRKFNKNVTGWQVQLDLSFLVRSWNWNLNRLNVRKINVGQNILKKKIEFVLFDFLNKFIFLPLSTLNPLSLC